MDNLELRQRIARSMIRVAERTQNMRRPEKFEYRRRKPTPQAVKKMKARMRYIAKEYEAGLIDFDAVDATMQSYFGMLGHCATLGLQKWIERNIIFKRRESEFSQEVNTWT